MAILPNNQPQLILVGGSNGSGKTTFAKGLIEKTGFRYIGADDFAYQLNKDDVQSVEIPAAKLFIQAITGSITNKESIVVESTLAGKTLCHHINNASENGYQIFIVYIYLESVEISLYRVRLRVSQGGHDVPEAFVRRRFPRSRENFWNLYRPLVNSWQLLYNSTDREHVVEIVAEANLNQTTNTVDIEVTDDIQWQLFLESVGVDHVT